jgi:hypothetical protein
MFPAVINESLIRVFSFYFEGKIHEGMSYKGKLYRLIQTFNIQQHSAIADLVYRLGKQGIYTAVTHSEQNCRVWVDLRFTVTPDNLETVSTASLRQASC